MPRLRRLLGAVLVGSLLVAAAPAALAGGGRVPVRAGEGKKGSKPRSPVGRRTLRELERRSEEQSSNAGPKNLRRGSTARRGAARESAGRLLESPAAAASARLDLIAGAGKEILVSSYIFTGDRAGNLAMAALRTAAREGKRVRLLLDGLGSKRLPREMLAHLAAEGVEIALYNRPRLRGLLRPGQFTRRMHDKLLVVDGESVVLGGRNVEEGYFGLDKPGYRKFTDVDLQARGHAARSARRYFRELWDAPYVERLGAEAFGASPEKVARFRAELDRSERMLARERFDGFRALWREKPELRLGKIRFLHEDPSALGNPDTRVHRDVIRLIDRAAREVEIQSPYLVPDPVLLEAIARARERGVTVRFVTNSAALLRRHEVFPRWAYEGSVAALARAGAEVWEYRGERSLHSKTVVADGTYALVGSFNMNRRSRTKDKEVALLSESPELARTLLDRGHRLRADSFLATRNGAVTPEKRATCGVLCRTFANYLFKPVAKATGLIDQF